MTKNSQQFKELLEKNDIWVEFFDNEGDSYCNIKQKLACGPTINLILVFDNDDRLVRLHTMGYITFNNPSRKEYVYSLLNELNNKYSYFKFVIDKENNISVAYYLPFLNNFSSDVVMQQILSTIEVMENEYAGFMKLIWA